MDRRRFVKSVGCAGTLAAATQLPAGASCMDEMMRLSQNRPSAHGMGYVVLDKDKTFAEQVTQENTIYEIRYEFDLGGETVPVPTKCIFKFEGGSIGNGSIEIQKSPESWRYKYDTLEIVAPAYHIFKNLGIIGEVTSDRISIEWFGAIGDGETDCTEAIRYAVKTLNGKGYSVYFNTNRTYVVKGSINYYDGKDNDVSRIAFVGNKEVQRDLYPSVGNNTGGIFFNSADTSFFKNAKISFLTIDRMAFWGDYNDWQALNVRFFDNCSVEDMNFRESFVEYINCFFYETEVWHLTRIYNNVFSGVYNFSYITGDKASFVDSSIYNNYINGGAPITKLDDGTPRCPLIDNSFFAWNACNGSEIHHNFIDYYACVYNCKLIYGNINSNHNHYQVFKYFHKDVTLYSFNDYFNWNDDEKDAIKDVMSRFAVETYEGKDGKTYNVPNYIASDRYYEKNVVIKDAVIEENIKNIIFRTGIGDGFKNPGKKFVVSLHDRAANRKNAIVYKEGADYPVFLPISVKYEVLIDRKLVHEYNEQPANLSSGAWGKMGIGEYVIVGNSLYQMSCYTDGENIVDYGLVKVLPLGWTNKG